MDTKPHQYEKLIVLSLLTVLLFACQKNDRDATAIDANKDSSSMPSYDPAMEPLTVGAKFCKKLGDSLGVKLYEFTVEPGDSWGLHTHPDHAVYVLEGGKMALFISGSGKAGHTYLSDRHGVDKWSPI